MVHSIGRRINNKIKLIMKLIKSNPHPTGKKIGDCVVRAIAIAENKKWIEIYKELCAIGSELFDMPNSKNVLEEYLKRHNWKKQPMPKDNGRRIKLQDWAEAKDGLFIASVVKHLTVVENNTLLDTWNCGNKCIGNYWIK
jgi:hypothetical protein